MITRYVNTASSAGGNGTTNDTTGDNRAYHSLNDALTYVNGLGSLSDAVTIYCEGATADTESCEQDVWSFSTTSTNYIRIVGNNTSGKWNTSAYRIETTNLNPIYNNYASHARLENLQAQITSTDSSDVHNVFRLTTANNDGAVDHRIDNCIARVIHSSGTSTTFAFQQSDPNSQGGTCVIRNCVAYGSGGYCGFASDGSTWAASNLKHINCTANGFDYNYMDTQININCLSTNPGGGDGTGFASTTSTGSKNNVSDEGSAIGTNSHINHTITYVDANNGDFRLDADDVGARGFGVGPGSDASVPSTDIDGTSRSGTTCDVGADEYAASEVSVTPTPAIITGTGDQPAPTISTTINLSIGNYRSTTVTMNF